MKLWELTGVVAGPGADTSSLEAKELVVKSVMGVVEKWSSCGPEYRSGWAFWVVPAGKPQRVNPGHQGLSCA